MKGDTISEVCVCTSKVLRQYRIPKEVNIDAFSAAMKQGSLLWEDPSSTNLDELINEDHFLSFTD